MDHPTCPDCGATLYDTGCPRPADECPGWGCQECGYGCDRDLVPEEDSACAATDYLPEEDGVIDELHAEAALKERP